LIEILVVIALLLVLFALAAAGVSYSRRMSQAADRANWYNSRRLDPTIGMQDLKTVRLLFFGNSLTQVNDLPRMIQALADADGSGVTVEYQTQLIGGSTLEQHWKATTTLPLIRSQPWDFVVLQEQGQIPYTTPQALAGAAQKFHSAITENGSIPLLYLTWARQFDLAQQDKANTVYYEVTKKLAAEIAPVGPAWQQSMRQIPQLHLYSSDQIHALPAGTYLAACVFYATIFNKSPLGLPGKLVENHSATVLVRLDDRTAQTLQQIAWRITSENRSKWSPEWRR
jgi:hypothetical protein